MSSIDNRIVQMEFDNSQFERGVKTTMHSLSSLDDQLNTLGSGGAISSISSGVEQIADRFSSMGIVAMSIIENLTDRVVNLGINMAKSITVDQVAAGMQKYESITTATVALVNQADISYEKAAEYVEKLAWYSDATSFSLENMVSGLLAFARQGQNLDKAIPTIMGIGNSVTYAGQSAKEGSRAFDIYARALSKGFTLRTWQELGTLNVATSKLKQQFIDAGIASGTLVKGWDGQLRTLDGLVVSMDNFDQTLSNQKGHWVTNKVLMKVMGEVYGDYTNELADATLKYQKQTGEVLSLDDAMDKLGNKTKKMGRIYLESATKARTFTEAVDAAKDAASTAFYQIAEAIFGTPEEAIELWTELNDFLVSTFAQPIVDIANIFGDWHDMGGRDEFIQGIKDIYNAVKLYLTPLTDFIEEIKPKLSATWLYDLSFAFSDFAERMRDLFSGKALSEWQTIENQIAEGIDEIGIDFSDYDISFQEWVDNWRDYLSIQERANNFINGFVDGLRTLKDILVAVIEPFKQLKKPLAYFADGMLTIASNFGLFISKTTEGGKVTEWFTDRLGPLKKIIELISKAIYWVTDALVSLSSSGVIGKAIKGIENLTAGLHPLKDIFEFLTGIVSRVVNGLKQIGKTLNETLSPVFGDNGSNLAQKIISFFLVFRTVFEGLDDLNTRRKMLSGLKDFIHEIGDIIINIMDATAAAAKNARILGFKQVALALLEISVALLIVSSIKWQNLLIGLGGMIAAITILVVATKLMDKFNIRGAGKISSMTSLAAGVLILALSLKAIESVDSDKLLDCWMTVSALILELLVVSEVANKFSKGNHLKGLTGLATAVLLLTASIAILGKIKQETLLQGGAAVTAIMLALTLFTAAIQSIDTKGFAIAILGVVELSAALLVMSAAVIALGAVPWQVMVRGLVAIAVVLAEIGGFAALTSAIAPMIVVLGAGMVLIAAAFGVLSAALLVIGSMGLDNMVNALIGLGVALAEIGVFTFLLAGLAPSMIALGAALLVMSAAILVMSAAFAVLGALGLKGIGTALLAVLGALLAFGTAGALIGGAAVVGMLAFAAGLAAISAALIVLGNALTKIATACILFKTAFGDTSSSVTTQFDQSKEQVSKSAKNLEEDLTESVENVEDTVDKATDHIAKNVSETELSTCSDIMSLIDTAKSKFQEGAISSDEYSSMMNSMVSGNFEDMNLNVIQSMTGMSGDVNEIMNQLGTDLDTESGNIGTNMNISWKSIGSYLMEGLKQGIRNKWQNLLNTMAELGNNMQDVYAATCGISSPSRVFMQFGEYIDQGLINGIRSYSSRVESTTEDLGEAVIDSFSKPMSQVAELASKDFDLSPRITPVLDLSNIQNGQNYLRGMLNGSSVTSSINGSVNANLYAMSGISSELTKLKSEFARLSENQLDETTLSNLLTKAMRNVDVYMDGSKVGKMVTSYQASANRAAGV